MPGKLAGLVLTFVETIKEGTTSYSVRDSGNTDSLAFRPPRDGSDPFAAFLREAEVARDTQGAALCVIRGQHTDSRGQPGMNASQQRHRL